MYALLSIIALPLIFLLFIFVESVFVKIASNGVFDTDISQKESFIICFKKAFAIAAISLILWFITPFLGSAMIANIVTSLLCFLVSSAILGNLIEDNYGEGIGFLKGLGVYLLSILMAAVLSLIIGLIAFGISMVI